MLQEATIGDLANLDYTTHQGLQAAFGRASPPKQRRRQYNGRSMTGSSDTSSDSSEGELDGSPAGTCPGRRGRLSAISVLLCKYFLYGAFVWARRALKHQKHRFPAPRAAACLVHELLTIAKFY
jgi:hypothetical protein